MYSKKKRILLFIWGGAGPKRKRKRPELWAGGENGKQGESSRLIRAAASQQKGVEGKNGRECNEKKSPEKSRGDIKGSIDYRGQEGNLNGYARAGGRL